MSPDSEPLYSDDDDRHKNRGKRAVLAVAVILLAVAGMFFALPRVLEATGMEVPWDQMPIIIETEIPVIVEREVIVEKEVPVYIEKPIFIDRPVVVNNHTIVYVPEIVYINVTNPAPYDTQYENKTYDPVEDETIKEIDENHIEEPVSEVPVENATKPTEEKPDTTYVDFVLKAFRIPSEHWGPTFESADAQMFFMIYNSNGMPVTVDFAAESGTTVKLEQGKDFYVYAADCEKCHGDNHDVLFKHWKDPSNTERPRHIVAGETGELHAFFEFKAGS